MYLKAFLSATQTVLIRKREASWLIATLLGNVAIQGIVTIGWIRNTSVRRPHGGTRVERLRAILKNSLVERLRAILKNCDWGYHPIHVVKTLLMRSYRFKHVPKSSIIPSYGHIVR